MISRDGLDQTLDLFLEMLHDSFGKQLISVLLYGSVVYDDLALGYGDLDFLPIVDDDLTERECEELVELRKPLRDGTHGILGEMLEGAFLPRAMLDPSRRGRALWWGTSGERIWHRNELGWLTLHAIRECGTVIWGKEIRDEIPVASRDALLGDVHTACQRTRQHGRGGSLHAVDWLLTAARLLLWLREGRFSSKSVAAEWASLHAKGEWRRMLPRAKQMRLNPAMARSADAQAWLEALTGPIQEACAEIERELAEWREARQRHQQ